VLVNDQQLRLLVQPPLPCALARSAISVVAVVNCTVYPAGIPPRPSAIGAIPVAGCRRLDDPLSGPLDIALESGFVSSNRCLEQVFELYSHSGCWSTKRTDPVGQVGRAKAAHAPVFAMAIRKGAAACYAGRNRGAIEEN
jgi:hypothetical protein